MEENAKFAVLLGRLIDLLRRAPDALDDHKAALRALTDLTGKRGATIRFAGGTLSVDGGPVGDEAPFAGTLARQMEAHGLAEIRLHHRASAMDVMDLVKAIALDVSQYGAGHDVEEVLRREDVGTVSVLTAARDQATEQRRRARVTEALEASGVGGAAGEGRKPGAGGEKLGVLPAAQGAAYEEMVRHQRASASTLAGAIQGMRTHPGGAKLTEQLEAFHAGVQKALEANEEIRALEAIVQLVAEEAATAEGEVRRLFGITLRRILTTHTLQRLARHLIDEVYAEDVTIVMRRAGTAGTKILLDLLVEARTFAERRAYLKALRQIEEGTDVVASLLNHHEWYVVRNAADLAGELGIAEAVGPLGKVVTHEDARVRRSVGIALARIGTPASVQHLAKLLRDVDRDVKLAVMLQVKGKGLAALSMPLVTAAQTEEDPELLAEYYHALGRIGTPDAIQALANVAEKSGGFLAGKKAAAPRVAAIEGLALAGSDAARKTLEVLRKDRAKEVRTAAEQALRGTLV